MSKDVPNMNSSVDIDTGEPIYQRIERIVKSAFSVSGKFVSQEEIEKARNLFFHVEEDEELIASALKPIDWTNFMMWFLCDYEMEKLGETPLHYFLSSEDSKILSPPDRMLAHEIAHSHLSLYDVISIKKKDGEVLLRDLFTLKGVKTVDFQILQMANATLFFGLRFIEIKGNYYSVGDIYVYPAQMKKDFVAFFVSQKYDPRAFIPLKMEQILKKKAYFFNYLQLQFRKMDDYKKKKKVEKKEPPRKVKKEEPVHQCKAKFVVLDFSSLKANIKDMKHLKLAEEKNGKRVYHWYKSDGDLSKGVPSGTVEVTPKKITVETQGEKNLDSIKGYLQKHLKKSIQHLYDTIEKRRNVFT